MVPGLKLTELLNLNQEDGILRFRGNRMLIFQSDALCKLRQEMIHTLGEDIARGMLARFGYRCGLNDVNTFRNDFDFENDADWMLAGPLMHTLEGVVHATTENLEFDRQKGTFFMTGIWRNSYEAEHHLRLFGPAKEPVCWTLSGYASGFGTGFMGRQVICVETMCQGMGDPYCRFELRSIESWNGSASRNIEDLKQCLVIKSLQKMVAEERERATLWWGLSNSMLDISTSMDSTSLPEKLVRYARELMAAEKAILAIVTEKTKRILLYEALEDNIINTKVMTFGNYPISTILKSGKTFMTTEPPSNQDPANSEFRIKGAVGVPLYSKNRLIGAIAVINKREGESFSPYDQEFLKVLGAQAAVALDNARLYERTNEKLQEKVTELYRLNKLLNKEKAALQKSAAVHYQLTALVLEGQGLDKISRKLAQMIDRPVLVADQLFQVLSRSRISEAGYENIPGIWNEVVKFPNIKKELLDFSSNTQRFRVEAANGEKNVVILPVMAGKDLLGYLATLEEENPLSELDCIALEHAATVIALEMLRQKATFETGQRLRKGFFEELLSGNYESEEVMKRQAANLGLDTRKPHRLISIEIAAGNISANAKGDQGQFRTVENFLEAVDRAVKNVCPEVFLSTGKKNIIGLLPITEQEESSGGSSLSAISSALEGELGKSFSEYQWWVGIGSPCKQLSDYAGSHKEACATIEIAKALKSINRCLAYENLGVYSLININIESFHGFIRRVIGPLVDYDEKNKSKLVETLKLYFKNNCNLQRAARNGFLNPATLKYRLRRIAEIGDIDLNNAENILLVHLALKLIEGI